MLVLSRKLGEKIFIGDNVCITVVDIDRGKVRLGIEAPREVAVYRQELLPDGFLNKEKKDADQRADGTDASGTGDLPVHGVGTPN